jgi:hypothetical protein
MDGGGSEEQDAVQSIFERTMKLSKDPVPSAKSASAQEEISRGTTNPFRHLGESRHCPGENLLCIKHF